MQTIWFGCKDLLIITDDIKGDRQYIHIADGSTLTYDLFEPNEVTQKEILLVVPGNMNFVFNY